MRESFNGIVGLAIADAIGVPVEFHSRKMLKANPVTTMMGYGTYNMPKGCWSDDTSLTLATIDGIIKNDGIINEQTYYSIADNFSMYLHQSAFTPTDEMFDIGNTTYNAIQRYFVDKVKPTEAGGNSSSNTGNGALMRILPLAYYSYHKNLSDNEIFKIVRDIASITHRLETCILGSYIYTLFAIELLNGKSKRVAYSKMKLHDFSFFSHEVLKEYSRILEDDIETFRENDISSLGKTRPTLEATLWSFLKSSNYQDAILTAINLGNDTDTIGACTGGLAGLYYGVHTINPNWLIQLKKLNYIKNLCKEFDKSISKT